MLDAQLTSYDLSRVWFDWCFDNPEKINPNHTAIYFFAVEHCNRLGWKEKFGFPTQMAMDAIGIKKHATYIRYFTDLCEWGFFKLIQKSTNQYSANIISLTSAMPKNGKALGKAIANHAAKQTRSMGQSNGQSNSTVDKPYNLKPNNLKPNNLKQTERELIFPFDSEIFKNKWSDWKSFRKDQFRKSFVPQGEQAALSHLSEISDGNQETAIKIINQSIAQSWQGLFKIKNENGSNQNTSTTGKSRAEIFMQSALEYDYSGIVSAVKQRVDNNNNQFTPSPS